jgi:tetratricopeptide (TPR) repeat protein
METQNWREAQLKAANELVNLGSQNLRQANVFAAEEMLGEAEVILDMAEEQDLEIAKLRARIFNEMGVIHQRRNQLDSAQEYHRKAAALCEEISSQGEDFRANSAATHLNLSSILAAMGRLDDAREAGQFALGLIGSLREEGDRGSDGMAMGAYQNLAVINARAGLSEKASEDMEKAIALGELLAPQAPGQIEAQLAQGSQQISVIMFESQAYETALEWGKRAEKLSEKAYEVLGQAVLPIYVVSEINLISYHEKLGNFADAENGLWKALDVVGNDPQILRRGLAFYEMCRKQADARLEAGNLPREEVEEGYADLQERIASIGGLPPVQEPPR